MFWSTARKEKSAAGAGIARSTSTLHDSSRTVIGPHGAFQHALSWPHWAARSQAQGCTIMPPMHSAGTVSTAQTAITIVALRTMIRDSRRPIRDRQHPAPQHLQRQQARSPVFVNASTGAPNPTAPELSAYNTDIVRDAAWMVRRVISDSAHPHGASAPAGACNLLPTGHLHAFSVLVSLSFHGRGECQPGRLDITAAW